jgi:hypothetical protein
MDDNGLLAHVIHNSEAVRDAAHVPRVHVCMLLQRTWILEADTAAIFVGSAPWVCVRTREYP